MGKPPKFQVGQAVAWVWDRPTPREHGPPPRAGTVFHVQSILERFGDADPRNGDWYYVMEEKSHWWALPEVALAPIELLPDEALAELLAETLEPVTA